jgi:pyruvate formate lyase activating enzyme
MKECLPVSELQGTVSSLERFATHDGPGIRTTVYMKGCPLKCEWCSSPHTQNRVPEILFNDVRCHALGKCAAACQEDAIQLSEDLLFIDRKLCNACGQCVDICTNRALEMSGQIMTVDELFTEVEKDSAFYRRSNGGVTVGGGELTMQSEFVSAFLKKCQDNYIHTAIETCGFSKWPLLESVLQHVDLMYLDIKHMDDERHQELTGVPNQLIHDNARKAAEMCAMIIRIPVVPGSNDSDENILATTGFASQLGAGFQHIELLPYHQLGVHRYSQLGRPYTLERLEAPDDAHMQRLKALVSSEGITAEIVA